MESFENGHTVSYSSSKKKAGLRSLRDKAREKTKKLLSLNDAKAPEAEEDVARNIETDPAFNPGFLHHMQKGTMKESAVDAVTNLSTVASSIISPMTAVKGKATRTTAKKLSKVQRPYLSKDADLDFLEAHDQLDKVESSRSSSATTMDDDDLESRVERRRAKVEEMKAHVRYYSIGVSSIQFKHCGTMACLLQIGRQCSALFVARATTEPY